METLLARAKAVHPVAGKRKPDKQLAQLAIAWAISDLTLKQVSSAMEKKGSAMYSQLSLGLRDAIRLGMLVKK